MKKGEKSNPNTLKLVNNLNKASKKNNAKIWAYAADLLTKRTREKVQVNLRKLNKLKGETFLVPGKVLAFGDLERKVEIAAYKYSNAVKRKVEEANGSLISIDELMKKNPKGNKVIIVK